ncbi:hypothetical protein MUK42_22875 [Musa troglodytarum]|uniref:Uncharacterized protein n=1 Tax=Musa troglodytarum TaxID=320322 RepID=A0A9E7K5M3_9LILI|nr:hypothetical protein MUK42_22875 [Musa troglodytarum]
MRGGVGPDRAALASVQLRQRPCHGCYYSVDWVQRMFGKDGCLLAVRQ